TRQLQLRFWTALGQFAEKRGTTLKFQSPLPQNWTTVSIGRSSFHMDATVSPQLGEVSVLLVIHTQYPKADYAQLFAQRDQIENEAGVKFEWLQLADKVQSRVKLRRAADPNDETTWPELFEWIVSRLELIRRVFGPRVKALTLAQSDDLATAA